MRPDEADAGRLWEMLHHARNLARRRDRLTLELLQRDEYEQYAVSKALELIGEAAWKVSAPFKAAHPGIPWEQISGMRHLLVHEYRRVNWGIVFRTATDAVAALVPALEPLVPAAPDGHETGSDEPT